jgi:indole-3-glycerol phosphate synthase / phosphoribosylanthranilate isomerase
VPASRQTGIVPFIRHPLLICEIKRKSPSKGDISPGLDHLAQAGIYGDRGVKSVSVLTEQDYFSGSLNDLIQVKEMYPALAVLRKDFLLDREDVDVSYRCGADAILLIASVLPGPVMGDLYRYAKSLGLEVLVEVHSEEDVRKAAAFSPSLTGINCRDLSSFRMDLALPLTLRNGIGWATTFVFESGIHSGEQAHFALSAGFDGILTGESVVRNPGLIREYLGAFSLPKPGFWEKLYRRRKPFVKICGITNEDDAKQAVDAGADILGFIFAESPRRANADLLRRLSGLPVLKAGVVITSPLCAMDAGVRELLDQGLLDVIQFHGDEDPLACYRMAFPYYKVLRLQGAEDIVNIGKFLCPRVLIDAYSAQARGGTGKRIPAGMVSAVREKHPLWLAGGVGPDNVREILDAFSPELIDALSLLEESPGIKDHRRVEQFIKEIKK